MYLLAVMKIFKALFFLPITLLLLFFVGILFTGCQKSVAVTTRETIHDTTIVYDTTVVNVIDTFYDLKNGLVGYYTFTNGSLKDSSGLNNNIILTNETTPAADRFGNANNAFLFNGTGSYMKIANNDAFDLRTITLFAIVKINGFYSGSSPINSIIDKGSPDNINGFFALRFSDPAVTAGQPVNTANESFYASFGDNAAGVRATQTITTDQWYYLAYTFDGFVSKIYINGKLDATMAKTTSFSPNNLPLFLGRHLDDANPYFFNGVMDEVRIYSRPLSQAEIQRLSR